MGFSPSRADFICGEPKKREVGVLARSDCFRSVNTVVLFDEGFYLDGGAQFISQTGPQADLGEQGPERGGRPPKGR